MHLGLQLGGLPRSRSYLVRRQLQDAAKELGEQPVEFAEHLGLVDRARWPGAGHRDSGIPDAAADHDPAVGDVAQLGHDISPYLCCWTLRSLLRTLPPTMMPLL